MKKTIIRCSLIAIIATTSPLNAWWWSEHREPTLEQITQDLQKRQADEPEDPYINYNLGVALYKAGRFGQAETNFDRALVAATTPELKQRCYFNLGNSFYRDALATLPTNWENAKTEPETLDLAAAKTSLAIKKYDNVLLLDKQHEPTKSNQKAAKDLLEKLAKKKQQQPDKKDQKNENNQNNQDKQNQDSADKSEQQKDNQGEKKSDKTKPEPTDQKEDPSGNKDKQESNPQEEKQSPKPENIEQRGMRALLENLQQDESKLQKELIAKKLKENEKPRESNQRPW